MEELGLELLKSISGGTVTGSFCVILIIVIYIREMRYWPGQMALLKAEIEKKDLAHEATRQVLLAEVRKGGETLVIVREQMATQNTMLGKILDFTTELHQMFMRTK